jgi:hypothetical protein
MVTVGAVLLALVLGPGHDLKLLRTGLVFMTAVLTVASALQYLILAPRFVDWGGR